MDKLRYNYNKDAHGLLSNNLLNYIADTVTTHNWPYGIDNQNVNNYTYDATGNMTADVRDTISGVDWTVYGKIKQLTNSAGTISYAYDPSGQRVTKTTGGITTYYIRDAQGNPLAIYDDKNSNINWREQHLYGSSRLGIFIPDVRLGTDSSYTSWDSTGRKRYELTNHLGNVLTTITDKRLQHINGSIDYFNPDIATAQEYYAFGGLMPGRTYATSTYRYGFNGKENDNDVKGLGNQQDYGMRIYDPRVGRFLSVDPIEKQYPALTPYQFASNSPIAGKDRDGLEFIESGAYATMQNRQYEANLRKTDPKNADVIIRQHNINAFLMVGGALTAGSGSIAGAFWDLIMTGGGVRTVQGIINHDKTQTSEGVHVMFDAAMGEIGGVVFGKTLEVVTPLFRSKTSIVYEHFESGSSYASHNEQELGNYSYSPEKGLELELNIPKDLQGKGFGTKIFSAAIRETNANKFTATWVKSSMYETGSSVNLENFYNAIKNGASETDAAWSTWSGQQAKAAGFKNVTVKRLTGGIEATFTK